MHTKSVLITGCSTGIGRALATTFNAAGYKVWATARRVDSIADLAAQGINTLALDVNDAEQIAGAVQAIEAADGKLGMLVNNAGYNAVAPIVEIPVAEVRGIFETNVVAPIAMTQACLDLLEKGQGTVVNIGSIVGLAPTPFSGAYSATKAAVHAFSDSMRMELKPFGIDVVTVQPGGIESSMGENALNFVRKHFPDNSRYAKVREFVEARANASQASPTPVVEFAAKLVKALDVEQPASVVRLGDKSVILPALKRHLSTKRMDALLAKKFGLNLLRSK